jgi:16S rRNA (adenine1518-N6/adenine1519-N6)-dimethyltransferase
MKRRRFLGQHTLIDPTVASAIVEAAELKGDEVVYEIGTGSGVLTERLCKAASRVISSEIDEELYNAALSRLNYPNLTLVKGDGFDLDVEFDVFVSSLPYSCSSRFVRWLLGKKFKRAVVLLQKDFVDKLLAKVGSKNYRAVSVLAQYAFNITPILNVPPDAFTPKPKVHSSVVVMTPKPNINLSEETVKAVYKLFALRNKKVSKALKILTNDVAERLTQDLLDKRIATLTPQEAITLANLLINIYDRTL